MVALQGANQFLVECDKFKSALPQSVTSDVLVKLQADTCDVAQAAVMPVRDQLRPFLLPLWTELDALAGAYQNDVPEWIAEKARAFLRCQS